MNNIIEINKNAVQSNIEMARGKKKACLMVKANCYGLGAVAIKTLINLGYDYFGVSTLEEALEIRKINSQVDILIVSYTDHEDLACIKENNISITVYDFNLLNYIDKDIKFHLNFDTNMGRIGFFENDIEDIQKVLQDKEITPSGIYTHLACAPNQEKTNQVIGDFENIVNKFKSYDIEYIHIFNSFGAVNYTCNYDNMVRIGIGIWGYLSSIDELALSSKQYKPAITIKLKISNIKDYDGYLSYDHIDKVRGTVYTITAGYRDGIFRSLHHYEINNVGKIVGKINMCQFMLLASNLSYHKGDYITFMDKDSMYGLCDYANITTYEFLTALSSRYKVVII